MIEMSNIHLVDVLLGVIAFFLVRLMHQIGKLQESADKLTTAMAVETEARHQLKESISNLQDDVDACHSHLRLVEEKVHRLDTRIAKCKGVPNE